MLFVGCGGSGLRTLRRLRRELEYRLSLAGVTESEFPEAWQFMAVDVPAQELLEEQLKGYAKGSYIGLGDTQVGYRFDGGIDDQLIRRSSSRSEYVQWRPDPSQVLIDISQGAGAYRAVGRAVAAYSLNARFVGRLQSTVSAMSSTPAQNGLRDVAGKLGLKDATTGTIPEPVAVIVSSLGGGAGSGIYLDVADAMRGAGGDAWLQKSVGILYDPSIFYTQDKMEQGSIPANTLSAITELVSGRWEPWGNSPHLPLAGQPLGVRRGPEYPLIFGTNNGVVTLPNGDAVYETVANILANLVTSPDTANSFFEHLQANWSDRSQRANTAPAVQAPDVTIGNRPLSSIGFARVSLGRDRFGRYASERMTRMLIERIITMHIDDEVRAGQKTPEDAIKEIVARDNGLSGGLVRQFLNDCGLDEQSRSSNQVIDALRDDERIEEAISGVQGLVEQKISDPKQVIAQFQKVWSGNTFVHKTAERTDLPAIRAALLSSAATWAEQIQDRVLDTIVRWVATQGLEVTIAVVRQAATVDLAKTLPAELRAEATEDINNALETGGQVEKTVKETKMRRGIPAPVRAAIRDLVRVQISALAERDLREVAAGLLEDMAANFFGPVLKALGEALETVRTDYKGQAFNLLAGEAVPASLLPPVNEKLIDPITAYPGLYVKLLNETVKTEVEAAIQAFAGEIGDETQRTKLPESQRAWLRAQAWTPDLAKLGMSGARSASPLRPSFAFTVRDVKERALAWMRADPASAIGRHMSESLSTYLATGSPTEQVAKAKAFARLLTDAFDAAKPFVDLNQTWLTSEFSYQTTYNFEFSSIPISRTERPDALAAVDLELQKHVQDPQVRQDKYDTAHLGDVEIYAWLDPFCPSGASSLAGPIVRSYDLKASTRKPGQADEFWRMRRSRPLLEAIPLPHVSRLAVTRGWITAVLADLVKVDAKKNTCTITVDGTTHQLLSPPLGNPDDRWAWLGMALESALFVQMLAASGQRGPFDALNALVRLGSSDHLDHVASGYPSPNPVLASATPPGLASFSSDQPPANVTEALEMLVGFRDLRPEAPTTWQPWPYAYQLAPLIAEAAEQMLAVADHIGGSGPIGPQRLPGS
ncbi:MAG: tubulin-like doman-containing protein [Acidimicrobiales bacterium]